MTINENALAGGAAQGSSCICIDSESDCHCSALPQQNQLNVYQLARSTADLRKLDTRIEYIVDGLIPKDFITLLYAPSGIGKSTLITQLSQAVQDGKPFMGLATIKTPTFYLDYENPSSAICERLRKIGADEDFLIWDHGCSMPPPQIDNAKSRKVLFDLKPGTLLVIDTLKASNNQDENSSTQMKPILDFVRSLRTHGLTIIVLHHTNKGIDVSYRGSSVIKDQSDHCLSLSESKLPSTAQKANDKGKTYLLATDKTRARPFETFLAFDPELELFVAVDDPDIASMKLIAGVIGQINSTGEEPNQSRIISETKNTFQDRQVRKLLEKGNGTFWSHRKGNNKNAKVFSLIPQSDSFDTLKSVSNCQTGTGTFSSEEKQASEKTSQMPTTTEFDSLTNSPYRAEKLEVNETTDNYRDIDF